MTNWKKFIHLSVFDCISWFTSIYILLSSFFFSLYLPYLIPLLLSWTLNPFNPWYNNPLLQSRGFLPSFQPVTNFSCFQWEEYKLLLKVCSLASNLLPIPVSFASWCGKYCGTSEKQESHLVNWNVICNPFSSGGLGLGWSWFSIENQLLSYL